MNTATQLLERCAELIGQNLSFIDESENLLKDIEAYLAKQQVEQEPVGTVRTCVWNGNGFTISATVNTKLRFNQALYTSPQVREQVDQEPIYTTGAPLIFAIKLINSDLTLIENIKTREDLNVVIKSIRDQLQAISAYANKIIAPSPQAREPMSEGEIAMIYIDATGFSMNDGHGSDIALLDFARAIEAHHDIRVKIGVTK